MPRKQPKTAPPLDLDAFRQPAQDAGLSLDSLTAAFAEMLDSGSDPYASHADRTNIPSEDLRALLPELGEVSSSDGIDESCEITPQSILESLLFVGGPAGKPITSKHVASLMRGVRPAEVDIWVGQLNRQYRARNCPYHVISSGAGYQLVLRDEYAHLRAKFSGKSRQARLSSGAVEILSLVAYHESLTAEEISKLRGSQSRATLSQLVRRELLRFDRPEGARVGRYFTTERFLRLFGLETLNDLPRSHDLEKL